MKTGSTEFLDALVEAGVSYLFANLGSDHPGLVEAIARYAAMGRPVPQLVTCPTELVALSAAHGFAQVSGRLQAVIVHVECGTQSLAGAVHNAAKGRIPVLIYAGTSPSTQHGELKGSRNEFIQWVQDVFDQRGLVRGYMRYDSEFRAPHNVKEITHRAIRFACSDPKGPAYLVGSREIMEAEFEAPDRQTHRSPLFPTTLSGPDIARVAKDLLRARRPLIVTSYLGRNSRAVTELVTLCDRLGVGVLESVPNYMNFPHDHDMYLGNQWNGAHQNPVLADADVILVIDSDVPWIPLINRPSDGATIHHIDVDPLKEQMPLSAIAAANAYRADAETALHDLNNHLSQFDPLPDAVEERRAYYRKFHRRKATIVREKEQQSEDYISAEFLTACIRERIDDDCIVLNEGISNYETIMDHLRMTVPGSIFTSGGGSLGWNSGAAVGAKLAFPEKTVVALTGDGSYMMSIPSSAHWMSRRYKAPFLQVIYNNGGWKSPKLSTLAIHSDGYASRSDDIGVSFAEAPDYAALAVSSGAGFGRVVNHPGELRDALDAAFRVVREIGARLSSMFTCPNCND